MVLLGGLAASAGLFAWWFEGKTRRVASSLAAGALLLALGEGFRWIRVGESGLSAMTAEALPETPNTGVPTVNPPTNHGASGVFDLLAAKPIREFASTSPGASVKDGALIDRRC